MAIGHPTKDETGRASPPWWRAVLIGSLLIPPSVWFGAYGYVVVQTATWGLTSLQLGAVSVLHGYLQIRILFSSLDLSSQGDVFRAC